MLDLQKCYSGPKGINIKSHYKSRHLSFSKLPDSVSHKKLALLKVELASNQAMLYKSTQDSEVAIEISFQISLLIAKRCKPFTDDDFIKDCFEIVSQRFV